MTARWRTPMKRSMPDRNPHDIKPLTPFRLHATLAVFALCPSGASPQFNVEDVLRAFGTLLLAVQDPGLSVGSTEPAWGAAMKPDLWSDSQKTYSLNMLKSRRIGEACPITDM